MYIYYSTYTVINYSLLCTSFLSSWPQGRSPVPTISHFARFRIRLHPRAPSSLAQPGFDDAVSQGHPKGHQFSAHKSLGSCDSYFIQTIDIDYRHLWISMGYIQIISELMIWCVFSVGAATSRCRDSHLRWRCDPKRPAISITGPGGDISCNADLCGSVHRHDVWCDESFSYTLRQPQRHHVHQPCGSAEFHNEDVWKDGHETQGTFGAVTFWNNPLSLCVCIYVCIYI